MAAPGGPPICGSLSSTVVVPAPSDCSFQSPTLGPLSSLCSESLLSARTVSACVHQRDEGMALSSENSTFREEQKVNQGLGCAWLGGEIGIV
jgi:hypothetical protein